MFGTRHDEPRGLEFSGEKKQMVIDITLKMDGCGGQRCNRVRENLSN